MNFERKNFNLVLIRSYKYHISVVQYLHPAHSGLGAKFLYMCFFLHILSQEAKVMKKHSFSYDYLFFLLFIFTQLIGVVMTINTQISSTFHLTPFRIAAALLLSLILAYPLSILSGKALAFIRKNNPLSDKKPAERVRVFSGKRNARKLWLCVWAGIFILWMIYFLAYYPGILAYDVKTQWRQYFGIVGYNTKHPLLHTMLMGGIIDLGEKLFGSYNKGVACYCLLQLLIVSGAVTLILFYIHKMTVSGKLLTAAAIYLILFPVWPFLGISTTKDTYFAIFFLLSFMALLHCCRAGITIKNLLLAAVSLTAALLFRNNAVYGVMLAIFLLLIFMIKKSCPRKIFLSFAGVFLISVILAEGTLGQLEKAAGARPGSIAETLSIPCQQIARVYNEREHELSTDEKNQILAYIPEKRIRKYKWQLSDPIKKYWDVDLVQSDWNRFLRLWADLGLQYPKEYLEATLCNTMPLWYVWDESIVSVHGVYMESEVKDVTDGKVTRHSLLPRLEKVLSDAYSKGYVLKIPVISLLFAPAFYLWIIIACGFLILKYRRYEYLVLPVFLLSYAATLMAGPCILPRYCMNFMLCVPLLIVCTGISIRSSH